MDQSLHARWPLGHLPPGMTLPYRDQGAIVENKRLSEALEMCRAMQAELPPKLRSRKAPARTSQAEHMFSAPNP